MAQDIRSALRVPPGTRPNLAKVDPRDRVGVADREEAAAIVRRCRERLVVLQGYLASENRRSVLVVLQGMDASGKDGLIRTLMSGLNPMIVPVVGFDVPTEEELAHDFLWRIRRKLPPRGRIALFNRSHYEDVLVVRVDKLVPEDVWRPRYETIADFEARLAADGTTVVKFMLHISPEEQLRRLRERVNTPAKRWKFRPDDVRKGDQWSRYMKAYEEAIFRTGTALSPWYVVPADRKWARNALVFETLVSILEDMHLPVPTMPAGVPAELRKPSSSPVS